MSFFAKIDGAVALLYQSGVYKQAEVYTRNELVFVKHGQGYARVAPNMSGNGHPTSVPKLQVLEFDLPPNTGIVIKGHQLQYRGAKI